VQWCSSCDWTLSFLQAPRPSRVGKWQAVSGCEALRGVPAVSIMVTWRREVTIQTASASQSGQEKLTRCNYSGAQYDEVGYAAVLTIDVGIYRDGCFSNSSSVHARMSSAALRPQPTKHQEGTHAIKVWRHRTDNLRPIAAFRILPLPPSPTIGECEDLINKNIIGRYKMQQKNQTLLHHHESEATHKNAGARIGLLW
jgi:hypothetical protein